MSIKHMNDVTCICIAMVDGRVIKTKKLHLDRFSRGQFCEISIERDGISCPRRGHKLRTKRSAKSNCTFQRKRKLTL
jgi:hypothetical protein